MRRTTISESLEDLTSPALVRDQSDWERILGVLAHELRNPLTPLAAGIDLLRARQLDVNANRVLDTMERQVRLMSRLVDDVFDLARIARGSLVLRTTSVDLVDLTTRVVEGLRVLSDKRRLQLTTVVPGRAVLVSADSLRLEQVLANLLTNALRCTEPGGAVTVCVEIEGNSALLRVRDTGVGIPSEHLESIFEPFVQLKRPNDDRRGMGIGLSLVRSLVDLHGGSVRAVSAGLGHGAEFIVRLPLSSLPS